MQLQVPQVTEEAALAIIQLYPTLISLARAYSKLVSPLILVLLFSFTCETCVCTQNNIGSNIPHPWWPNYLKIKIKIAPMFSLTEFYLYNVESGWRYPFPGGDVAE
jgi:hypothetical protein